MGTRWDERGLRLKRSEMMDEEGRWVGGWRCILGVFWGAEGDGKVVRRAGRWMGMDIIFTMLRLSVYKI